MGVWEGDCRACEPRIVEPAHEGVAGAGGGDSGRQRLGSSGGGCGDGSTGVGIEADV